MDQIQQDHKLRHEQVIREMRPRLAKNRIPASPESDTEITQDAFYRQGTLDSTGENARPPTVIDGNTSYSTQSQHLLPSAARRNRSTDNRPRPKVQKPQHLRSGRSSGSWNSGSVGAPENSSGLRSFLSAIGRDSWALTRFTARLTGTSYSIWKWLLLAYVMWMGISYSFAIAYVYAIQSLSPICSLPLIGSRIPFCEHVLQPESERSQNMTKMATSQTELTHVMNHVGQNFDLARQMVEHEFVVRDLRIRVGASNLSRKREIGQELETLLTAMKSGAKRTSRMTAKIGKVVDLYRAFDDHAISSLETIGERQEQIPSISDRVLSAISPWAAWELAARDLAEEKVKSLFLSMTNKVSMKVKVLIDDAFMLNHDYDTVLESLTSIGDLIKDEHGDLPRHDILSALWASLVKPDEHEALKSHGNLLDDMTQFCDSASSTMKETAVALNRLEAELEEFRDGFAMPALILQEYPVEVIIGLLKSSISDLDASKQQFRRIEGGETPPNAHYGKGRPGTRRVTATAK